MVTGGPALTGLANRALGWRALRSLVGCAATIAAFAAWLMAQDEATDSRNFGPIPYDYRLDGPVWAEPALIAAAIAFVLAAVLIWAALRPWVLAAGLALLAVAAGVMALADYTRSSAGRVPGPDVLALPLGSSHSDVREALGAPAGHGSIRRRGERLDCLVYISSTRHLSWQRTLMVCFEDDRLAARRRV